MIAMTKISVKMGPRMMDFDVEDEIRVEESR